MTYFRMRHGAGMTLSVLAMMALVSTVILRSSDASAGTPTYSITFYAISAGGNTLHGSCYVLSGTLGQTAPGYSSGSIDSLIAGYWQPALIAATDEIFFNGFQGC
jgi:hypothetical protein